MGPGVKELLGPKVVPHLSYGELCGLCVHHAGSLLLGLLGPGVNHYL